MARVFNNTISIGGKYSTEQRPIDDRLVVLRQSDLFSSETWENRGLYHGIPVCVINDTADNNGIYVLTNRDYYDKQLWDPTAENYNNEQRGWFRVGANTGQSGIVWVTFTKAAHSNGAMTCDKTYAEITAAISGGSAVIAQYQPAVQNYPKQYFTLPTYINANTLLFANMTPNSANEVLFVSMTSSAVTLAIEKDYAIPDVANNDGKVLVAVENGDRVEWQPLQQSQSTAGTLDTTNTASLTPDDDESLSGTIDLHKVAKTGSYNDLNDKPTIPAAQVNSDWNASSGVAEILNKPTIPTLRTMNHEQLTDSTLGDINIHDGFYFPNVVQDYDGNWYGAIILGDQVWLAENLRTKHFADGTLIADGLGILSYTTPYYIDYTGSNIPIEKRGLIYNWSAVMNGHPSVDTTPSNIKDIAPGNAQDGTGIWHIPSRQEFSKAWQYIYRQKRFTDAGNGSIAGSAKPVANIEYWRASSTPNTPGYEPDKNNSTGFNIYPAPSVDSNGDIETAFADIRSYFWTTSLQEAGDTTLVHTFGVSYNSTNNSSSAANQSYYYPIRCVCDLDPVQFRVWYINKYGSMQHHLPEEVQPDWNQSDNTKLDFIKNKPTIPDTVSGVNDGTNWTSLTIGNTTKAISSGGSSLPSQTGNGGKLLKTDGMDASWATLNSAIPVLTSPVRIWDLEPGIYMLPDSCVVYYNGATSTSSFTIGCGGILNVWWEYPSNDVKGFGIMTSNGSSSSGIRPDYYRCGYTRETSGTNYSISLGLTTSNYGSTPFGIYGISTISNLSDYSNAFVNNGKLQGKITSSTSNLPDSLLISGDVYCLLEVINVASLTGTSAAYNQLRQDLYLPSLQKHYYRICNYSNSTITPDTSVANADTKGWVEVIETLPIFSGNAGKVLAVNTNGDGVEWVAQSGGGGGLSNYNFTHTANTTISTSTTTITFAANTRGSQFITISDDLDITFVVNNSADNYLWIANSDTANDVDITINAVTYGGNNVINVYMPTDGISVLAGELCEIGIIATADGAFITSRNDLIA